ncbi:amino acid adenylation domain-containing protein [Mesorhizobium sp. M1339]|uniref:non-ribosomal peptide synthetase n=1 Tax=unclassified Mesorhizobium TaxID=325217 RepID=UPI00333B30FB
MPRGQIAENAPDLDRRLLEYPLSHAQSRLWFLDKLTSGSPFYNLPLAVPLPGNVNRTALGLALNEVVRRHESLRCCIREGGEEPTVVVTPFEPFALPFTDVSRSGKEEKAELAEITTREAGRPFDLRIAPLARFRLLRLSGDRHLFLATMHHIVSDGWSMGVFWHELTTLYADAVAGRRPSLPEPDLQYGDYAVWQREQLSSGALEPQRQFWLRQLAAAEQFDLPTDFARPTSQAHRGATHSLALSAETARALVTAAQRARTTPFAVLLAGLSVVLGRYAGQTEVVIGTPVANRDREELEQMIGFFVNSVVLRIDLSGAPDFTEVVGRAGRTVAEALSHADYPFERLVEDLDITRDPSRNPLFQVTAQLFSTPGQKVSLGAAAPGRQGSIMPIDKGTALFDMAWNFWFDGPAIHGQVEFDTALFDPATVAAMADAFLTSLSAALRAPRLPIHDLPLVSGGDAAEHAPPPGKTRAGPDLWTRIRRCCEAEMDRIVVECGDVTLSGAELVRRVEAVAAGLRARGVGPENVVALNLDRSERLVIAALGVLAAGAAFMPLSIENPPGRNADIVTLTGCTLVILDEDGGEVPAACPSVAIGALATAVGKFAPVDAPSPGQLAYVILTSGSTGRPKAIAQTHAAIANQMDWLGRRFATTGDDAILFKTPLVFDASLWELFLPLCAGFRLVVADPETHRDPRRIVAELRARRITMLQLVPSMLRLVLDDLEISECTELRLLFTGGEPLEPGLVTATRDALPGCGLVNLYGPAETCVQSAIGADSDGAGRPESVTEAVDDNRLYLLGPRLERIPAGHPGELWIGGAGVARGYLGDPGLTAERFIPDPFSADGARIYRTGDRFVRRPDGRLDYKGRLDGQVKRSGIRIETGEIEAALLLHADVGRAACDMKGGLLLAYAETTRSAVELRRHLETWLPRQMLPDRVVALPAFPLLVSGKTDRVALAAAEPPQDKPAVIELRSHVDEAVATIWADILDRDAVSIGEDFFSDLGGHSLLAIRAVASMRDVLGIDFPLHLIFDHSTVETLVDALRRDGANADRLSAIEEVLSS